MRLADGTEHRADIVVSAADGYSTIFQMLGGRFVDDAIRQRYDHWPLFRPILMASFGVGRLFEEGEYYVPDMLISARAMQAGLAILKPALANANVQSAGKVAIGTVNGDLHDIGKNLVGMMLEGADF